MLTVGSLFSGIGGLELGLEKTNYFKTVYQVENNPYATKILEKHWPGVRRYGDIKEIKELPYTDVICGGFPCQDLSCANPRGKGLQGEKSGLWREMLRVIRMVRPRYVLVENVPALRWNGMDTVLGDIASVGYDAEWQTIPASALGAWHRRDRVFIVAYAAGRGGQGIFRPDAWRRARERALAECSPLAADTDNKRQPQQKGSEQKIRKRTADSNKIAADVDHIQAGQQEPVSMRSVSTEPPGDGAKGPLADAMRERLQRQLCGPQAADSDGYSFNAWDVEPDVVRLVHGATHRMDRITCLGNSVVPQVAQIVGYMIEEFDKEQNL